MGGQWTALAEQLADDAREPGFGAAACVAAAWAARVDPNATRGLVRAAMVLTNAGARAALWERLPPCPDVATLLTWGEELEACIAGLLRRCMDAGRAARREHAGAAAAQREAVVAARAAAGDGAALSAALDRGHDAAQVVADTENALDLLGQVDGTLRHALGCVRMLPADWDEAYAAATAIVAAGGALPWSGDFIVPGQPLETTTGGTPS